MHVLCSAVHVLRTRPLSHPNQARHSLAMVHRCVPSDKGVQYKKVALVGFVGNAEGATIAIEGFEKGEAFFFGHARSFRSRNNFRLGHIPAFFFFNPPEGPHVRFFFFFNNERKVNKSRQEKYIEPNAKSIFVRANIYLVVTTRCRA